MFKTSKFKFTEIIYIPISVMFKIDNIEYITDLVSNWPKFQVNEIDING